MQLENLGMATPVGLLSKSASVPIRFTAESESPVRLSIGSRPAEEIRPAREYVRIRPLQIGDAGPLFAAIKESVSQLSRWMTWVTADYSLEDCHAFITRAVQGWESGEHYTFGIFDMRDQSLAGSIALNHLSRRHNFANVGYWVRTARTRSGIGSAAATAAARFGFDVLGLHRLEFLIPTTNIASQRVAQRAGAKFEGVLRNRLVLAGQTHDAAVYSLVPGDLLSPTTRKPSDGVEIWFSRKSPND